MEQKQVMSEQDLKLNELEQYSMKNCIIVSGVPETPDENVLGLIMEIGRLIGVIIHETDIDNAHRIGKIRENKARPVIVKFVRHIKRAQFYQERKSVREAKVDQESCFGPNMLSRIFMADCLTRHNSAIMFVARQLRREGVLARAWTDAGAMKVRLSNDGPTKKIRGIRDLHKIVGDSPSLGLTDYGISKMQAAEEAPAPPEASGSTAADSQGHRGAGPERAATGATSGAGRRGSSAGSPAATRSRAGGASGTSGGHATPQARAAPWQSAAGGAGRSSAGASGGRGKRRHHGK